MRRRRCASVPSHSSSSRSARSLFSMQCVQLSKPRDVNELYRIKLITENIRRVAEYASDIAEIVLNMTVQHTLRKG